MIRTVSFAALCLAGLGVVAVAKIPSAKISHTTPTNEIQATAGGKGDRLLINQGPMRDAAPVVDKIDAVYVAPAGEGSETPKETKGQHPELSPTERIVGRHWHDPYDVQAKHLNTVSAHTKWSKQNSAGSRLSSAK